MSEETMEFQAEVTKLLDIVIHSLYSQKEIFLRELISNGADACDRLRYAAITQPELLGDDRLTIRLSVDKTAKTLTVADNGIGMNRDDLVENLGTIAKSGTQQILENLTGDSDQDINLIGQFGVGFYSAFMVARKVDVVTRRAGEDTGWHWSSEGSGRFSIEEAPQAARGTRVTVHLAEGQEEFLEEHRIRQIVTRYSDHIPFPVVLERDPAELEEGQEREETLNSASALWTRPKSEITEDQYKEFYHHVSHAFDDPWLTIHYQAEGTIAYTALLFVPSEQPHDVFHPDRKPHVKLYVRRVFITEDSDEVLPAYLRFLRGVVDSEDLPLNVSREMLQHNPVLAKIRNGIVKRVLGDLKKKAENAPDEYEKFWNNFGAILKEGLYEDFSRRDEILELTRFRTTRSDGGLVSLQDYVNRMRPGQEAIYYITGDDPEALRQSPLLEGFAARDVEVLLLTDPIDEFWVPLTGQYGETPFRSVSQGRADLDNVEKPEGQEQEEESEETREAVDALLQAFKTSLGGRVQDVRRSERLTDSPVCLVAEEGGMNPHLERLLRAHQQMDQEQPRVLEVNPTHPLVRRLGEKAEADSSDSAVADAAHILYDQARIVEGESIHDPAGFSKRLSGLLERAFQ